MDGISRYTTQETSHENRMKLPIGASWMKNVHCHPVWSSVTRMKTSDEDEDEDEEWAARPSR